MIKVIGHPLHQWNTGRWLEVDNEEATHWLLANEGDSRAVRLEAEKIEVEGKEKNAVKIPDYLLLSNKNLIVQAIKAELDVGRVETLESATISIRKAPRPQDYVYEDDRRNYVYELVRNAENAIDKANATTESLKGAAINANAAANSAIEAARSAYTAATRAGESADKADRVAEEMQDSAVLTSPQNLEKEKQKQARDNIGAVSFDDLADERPKEVYIGYDPSTGKVSSELTYADALELLADPVEIIAFLDISNGAHKATTQTIYRDEDRYVRFDFANLGIAELDSDGVWSFISNDDIVGDTVRYTKQTLPEEKKKQARKNIGVEDSVLAMLVDFGIAPVLLDADGAMLVENDGTILINM